jgi:hypothetical protein
MLKSSLIGLAAITLGLAPAGVAFAAAIGPVATINITAAPALRADTKVLSDRDINDLTASLRESLQRSLTKAHVLSDRGGVLNIQLVKAKPTRPTFTQMGANTGLSPRSVYIGGMEVAGTYTAPDGTVTPVKYHWEAFDISEARFGTTWSDAERGFDYFASSLTRG